MSAVSNNKGAEGSTNTQRPPSPTRSASTSGLGKGDSTLSSSGGVPAGWTARGISTTRWLIGSIIYIPYRFVTGSISWALDKIYGKGRIPAQTITVEVPGWLWGSSMKKVSLEYALEKKLITPEQAVKNNHCLPAYLTARGWNVVEFDYKGYTGVSHMKLKLRSAIRDGYLTIEEAIKHNFITKEQAIEGGFMKAEKQAKVKK
jgi:hypothetical protein